MKFFLLSLGVYGVLTLYVAGHVRAATEEWAYTLAHFALAAAANAYLLHVVARRRLAMYASPVVVFLLLNLLYFTFNALKYFSPILLFPQFNLSLEAQFWGSAAGVLVLMLCIALADKFGAPSVEQAIAWARRYWVDLRRVAFAAVVIDAGCKASLIALGYGSSYTDSAYTIVTIRNYWDFLFFLGSSAFGHLVLLLAPVLLLGSRRLGPVPWTVRIVMLAGLLFNLAYGVLFLKARAPILIAAVFFALGSTLVSLRSGIRWVRVLMLALPPLSLLSVQLTLAIGRTNLPEDAGLRLAIGFVNRRTDLTDFSTALLLNSRGTAYDPAIMTEAALNAIPRAIFPGKDALLRDVYSQVLGRLNWPAGLGLEQLADYQDSIISTGVMAFGYAGFLIMPILHILALCWLARAFGRQSGRLWYGLALLSLTVSASHVEVEPATLILDYRQALASFLMLWVLAFVLRVLAHTVRVASLPPVRAPGTVGAAR
jgi:hypothetical protein